MIVTNVNLQVPIGEIAKFKKQTIQKVIHKYTPTLDKANTVTQADRHNAPCLPKELITDASHTYLRCGT